MLRIALGYEEIRKNLQIIMKLLIFFISKYNWYGVNFPSEKDEWVKIGKINSTIALNVLCEKEKEICPACISKYNSTREKQIVLLIIYNGKG